MAFQDPKVVKTSSKDSSFFVVFCCSTSCDGSVDGWLEGPWMMLICRFYCTAALPSLKHYSDFPLILKTSPRYARLAAIQKVKNLR